jgi:hypothetical protein
VLDRSIRWSGVPRYNGCRELGGYIVGKIRASTEKECYIAIISSLSLMSCIFLLKIIANYYVVLLV